EAARAECLVAMRGADADPHGNVADGERSHAMHAGGARDAKLLAGGFYDTRAFLLGELGEGLVFEAGNCVALVVIAHPAFEGGKSTAGLVAQRALQRRGVERSLAEAEGRERRIHPPATGGMKTTASP